MSIKQSHRDPRACVEAFLREIEIEYEVDVTWSFRACPDFSGRPMTICIVKCEPPPWSDDLGGGWELHDVWPDRIGMGKMAASQLRLLSKLALDLQMFRSYGLQECEYFTLWELPQS